MKPRKLVVINIEDRHPLSLSTFRSLVDIVSVKNETDLQKVILDDRRAITMSSADIFVLDINMIDMEMSRDIFWQTPADICPLGPLMALPFLMRGDCTVFVPYSNYWRDPAVTRNGYLLFGISLLLAASTDEQYTLEETRNYLEDEITRRSLFAEAEAALVEGIERFRRRLREMIVEKKASVVNVGRALGRLATLDESYGADVHIPLPLCDDNGVLYIEVRWASMRLDLIELSSIFGDRFLRRPVKQRGVLREIAKELSDWSPDSVEEEPVYDVAVRSLKAAETACEGPEYILHVIRAKLHDCSGLRTETEWQVRRLVVEFAWVRAWMEEIPRDRLEAVRRHLGLMRSDTDLRRQQMMDPGATRKYMYLVAGSQEVVPDDVWRRPFKLRYSNNNDAYQLNVDEPACLTPIERALCRRYALEVLGWDEAEKRYPLWLAQSAH